MQTSTKWALGYVAGFLALLWGASSPGQESGGFPSRPRFQSATVVGNATVGGTLGVTGASTLAALGATTGTFSSTLGVTGASTLAALSATTGTFSSTLGVTGATTLAALSATSATIGGVAISAHKIAYGFVGSNPCAVTFAVNIVSCTRTAVGSHTVTLSGFTSNPVCTLTPAYRNGNYGMALYSAANTVNIFFSSNAANALADDTMNMICVGT